MTLFNKSCLRWPSFNIGRQLKINNVALFLRNQKVTMDKCVYFFDTQRIKKKEFVIRFFFLFVLHRGSSPDGGSCGVRFFRMSFQGDTRDQNATGKRFQVEFRCNLMLGKRYHRLNKGFCRSYL